MELPQNFLQTFACVASEKNFLPKMELPQNFLQSFACIVSEKKFLQKMELPQNFLQNFSCVASEKKLSPKNGVASKYLANIRFFLLVYTWFSNIVNDSASLHRLIKDQTTKCAIRLLYRSFVNIGPDLFMQNCKLFSEQNLLAQKSIIM